MAWNILYGAQNATFTPLAAALAAAGLSPLFGATGGTINTSVGGIGVLGLQPVVGLGAPTESLASSYVSQGPAWATGKLQWIGWDFPVVAYPGIDVNYKLTGYDWFNGAISWSIVAGPGGMSINSHGVITWVPPTDHVTQSVTVQAAFTLTGFGTYSVQKTFSIKVESTQVLFVATSANGGSDTNAGTQAAPYASIGKAMSVAAAGMPTTPRLILIQTGTYNEQYGAGATYPNSANWAKGGSSSSFMTVRNYPSQSVTLNLGTGTAGLGGINLSGTQSVVYGFAIQNGTETEGGCVQADSTACVKLMTLSGYNAPFNNNPAGIKFTSGALIDNCVSYGNYDHATGVSGGTYTNNADYLGFCDSNSLEGFVIDCIAGNPASIGAAAQTGVGRKIKHSGPGRIHWHRCVSFDCFNGTDLGSDWSTSRFCLDWSNQTAVTGAAIAIGGASGTNQSNGALVDGCLLISAAGQVDIEFGASGAAEGGTFTSSTTPLVIRASSLATAGTPSTSYPGQNYAIDLYPFSALPADGPQSIFMTSNTFYGTDTTKLMLYPTATGTSNVGSRSLAQINALTGCSGNTFAGVAGTLTFQAAFYNWTYSGGTLSGVAY